MVVQLIDQTLIPEEEKRSPFSRISKRVTLKVKNNSLRTIIISSLALVMLIKRVLAQDNNQPTGVNVLGPTRHVVPRAYSPGWYPMWDAHYTNNFYVASGKDDISWGRERHTDKEDANRAKRRVWIEAIQDHEGFSQSPGRDEVITCGIGGCERFTIDVTAGPTTSHPSGDETDGAATNKTVFRHQEYWDWLGRKVTNAGDSSNSIEFGDPNTYRSDHVSTVAIIQFSSHFLCGGTVGRGVTRFNYRAGNNTYWLHNLPTANLNSASLAPVPNAMRNVSTDVTDLFVIRPAHWFVVCRTRMPYEVVDYTNMNSITTFDRGSPSTTVDEIQTGGFGDFVDFVQSQSRVCISHDYTDMITCWDLTNNNAGPPGSNIVIHKKFRTGWPIRALSGFYESPYFAVCGRKYIKVYNTWETVATATAPAFNTQHTAIWTEDNGSEVSNELNHQIWDLVYINTHSYTQGNFFGGTLGQQASIPRNSDTTDTITDTSEWDNV